MPSCLAGRRLPRLVRTSEPAGDMDALVPFRQFVLKVHSRCDLSCDHCYVYEHADQSWRSRPKVLSAAVAAQTAARVAEHVRAHDIPEVTVIFHGGEPLLAGQEQLAQIARVFRAALGGLCQLDLRIHTNGILLDSDYCEVFRSYGVKIGISLDGDQVSNDRHRRYASGRGSYPSVVRAINMVRKQIPELYAGLLCTIDVRNDPIAVYRELAVHVPPAIDFLLPHATWDNPPYRTSDTTYADWLIRIFDAWLADGMPMAVRTFDSIIRTAHGGGSLTESLGLEPVDLLVVETDGALEQADSLKTAYDGAPATGFSVFANALDEVARHPGIVARQRGIASLAVACRQCPVMTSCGGGLYAHRYRSGSDFGNPSVYCADLLKLIEHIRRRTQPRRHAFPRATLDLLATGYGGPREIGHLADAQRTIRRALVSSVPRDGENAAAWAVISQLDREDRESVDAVLGYPFVRVWAAQCLRGQAEAADIAAIAAAAAIRAGADARLGLPARKGMVHLPGIGSWQVDKTASIVPIEISGGLARLPVGSIALPLRTLTAGPVSILLDDLDPYRDCYGQPAAARLSDAEVAVWQQEFRAAWQLIERDYPGYAPGLARGCAAVVPLAPTGPARHASATARDAFGAVAIGRPADPAVLALLLIHEFQHVKLGALLDVLDLYDPSDVNLYYAAWRDDPRPLEGLLQGAYAHIAVTDYWRVRRLVTADLPTAAAFTRWFQQTMEAIDTLAGSGTLTEDGAQFVAGMRVTVAGWQAEPVPDAARQLAEDDMRAHRAKWLAAHGRETTGDGW